MRTSDYGSYRVDRLCERGARGAARQRQHRAAWIPLVTAQGKAAMRSLGKVAGPNGAAKGDATSEDQRP